MISVRSSALGNQKLINVSLANRSDVAMDIRDAQVLVTAKPGKVCRGTSWIGLPRVTAMRNKGTERGARDLWINKNEGEG
jgi:hypothetical protein